MTDFSDHDIHALLSKQVDRKAARLAKLQSLEEHSDWFSGKVYGALAWVVARRLSELLLARAALSAATELDELQDEVDELTDKVDP